MSPLAYCPFSPRAPGTRDASAQRNEKIRRIRTVLARAQPDWSAMTSSRRACNSNEWRSTRSSGCFRFSRRPAQIQQPSNLLAFARRMPTHRPETVLTREISRPGGICPAISRFEFIALGAVKRPPRIIAFLRIRYNERYFYLQTSCDPLTSRQNSIIPLHMVGFQTETPVF